MTSLRAVVIIDYQNVHLTGHGLFACSRYNPPHEALADPLHFANQLISARNQSQKAHWERDRRVTVQLRPLKYRYERDGCGRPLVDADGKRVVKGKDEKGVDVLCALAVVREARKPDVDLVVLASHDSDLEPALDAPSNRSPDCGNSSTASSW